MKLKKIFAIAIVVQSVGPLTLFLSIWIIARKLGVEVQGQFAAVKSLVELMVACLLFGLPQSFVFGVNKLEINRGDLVRWILCYSLIVALFIRFVIWIARVFGWALVEIDGGGKNNEFYLIIAVTGMVVFGLLRGVYLTVTDDWRFSLLTISPTIILAFVVFISINLRYFDAVKIYALTGLLSALISIYFLKDYIAHAPNKPMPWGLLLNNGSAVFFQSIFLAIQPYLTLTFLQNNAANFTDVAYFSLAMYVYQAGVIPLTMVAPILYSRWTRTTSSNDQAAEVIQLLWGIIPVITLVVLAWLIAPWMLTIIFGQDYVDAVPIVRIMIATIPLLYVVQVGAPVMMSMGLFKTNLLIVMSRLAVCAILLTILHYTYSGQRGQMAAWSWLAAEGCAAIFTAKSLRNKLFKPVNNK